MNRESDKVKFTIHDLTPFLLSPKTAILSHMQQPIGILGGTFDPVHLGHIHLAKKMLEICGLQKIVLVPCNQSPLRDEPYANANDRLNMANLAIQDQPQLQLDDREIKRSKASYTVKTLESLRQDYPDTPLAFIMGIDAFNNFDQWHEHKRILELAHLIVANRPKSQITNPKIKKMLNKHQINDPKLLQNKPAGLIYQADIRPLPISATAIRALIKDGKTAKHLVATDVWDYICKNKLYI